MELYNPQDGLTPQLANATLTAPASAPNGATGLVAYVRYRQSNVTYVWSITNGTITAGLGTQGHHLQPRHRPLGPQRPRPQRPQGARPKHRHHLSGCRHHCLRSIAFARHHRPSRHALLVRHRSLRPRHQHQQRCRQRHVPRRLHHHHRALARDGQTATQLRNGSVLVAGGTVNAAPTEIYTEGFGAFTSTAPMLSARKAHTATLLTNGKVLLAGGFDAAGDLASAEIFDPINHTFSPVAGSMAHARRHHAAILLPDGRVLLLGGSNSAEGQLASAEVFDPATDTFSSLKSSLAQAREFATATALPGGSILVAGGTGSGGTTLNTAELYLAGSFQPRSFPMRSRRTHHTATLLPPARSS